MSSIFTILDSTSVLCENLKLLSGMFRNATAAGSNETNSTQGMMMNMMKQGMMKSGMQNVSQGELQHLKDFVFCSPANEKTMRSIALLHDPLGF